MEAGAASAVVDSFPAALSVDLLVEGMPEAGARTTGWSGDPGPWPDGTAMSRRDGGSVSEGKIAPVAPHALSSLPDSLTDLMGRSLRDEGEASSTATGSGPEASGPLVHTPASDLEDFPEARFPRPEHVRGLYVNAWAAGSAARIAALLETARRTEINAFVIDIKDASGYVSHASGVPMAREVGATGERRIRDLPGLLDRLEAEGIYPIARIVVAKDPVLASARPGLAIQDTSGGVWIDRKEIVWLNLYEPEVWRYHVDLAREVAAMGFPEIQWDYIRFPDAPEADLARAVFPGAKGRSRTDAVRGFLSYARESLSDLPVRSTADVFGVTTTFNRDIGLGQLWESFIDVVDVALPMVYPSHYWEGSFGYDEPNAYPYEVVRAALEDALRRSGRVHGAGLTRPWIQDFTLGRPVYGPAEVRAQIQAAYDVGIEEWILWNPSSRYTVGALEPTEGFLDEPLLRVAGVLTPASRRFLVIDSVEALPPAPDSLRLFHASPGDSAATLEPSAGVASDPVGEDSVDTAPADTVSVAADTLGPSAAIPSPVGDTLVPVEPPPAPR